MCTQYKKYHLFLLAHIFPSIYNFYLWYSAGKNSTICQFNFAAGYFAMWNGITTWSKNFCLWAYSLYNLSSWENNLSLWYESWYGITTWSWNILIWYRCWKTQYTTQSNLFVVANDDTANPLIYGVFPNTSLQINATLFTQDIQPKTDNTYYIWKNDDDSPLAYKGIILKDTTNGKYYRIEIINWVITPTDLTD